MCASSYDDHTSTHVSQRNAAVWMPPHRKFEISQAQVLPIFPSATSTISPSTKKVKTKTLAALPRAQPSLPVPRLCSSAGPHAPATPPCHHSGAPPGLPSSTPPLPGSPHVTFRTTSAPNAIRTAVFPEHALLRTSIVCASVSTLSCLALCSPRPLSLLPKTYLLFPTGQRPASVVLVLLM